MTAEITADDVLVALSRHIGADLGVGIAALTREVTGEPARPGAERAVRRCIEELRRAGHHICAHPSTGYFIAASEAELLRTCSYLYSRAMCSLAQVAAMRRVSLPDLRGQLRLPT